MYSIVLMMAMSGSADLPECRHRCCGCSGGYYYEFSELPATAAEAGRSRLPGWDPYGAGKNYLQAAGTTRE